MKNIIVLEDNKDINEILTNILLKEGYNVFSSFNAFDALKDFKNNYIDCIITDLMLPVMSGEDFIQEVRKTSAVHIIVISAKTSTLDKLEVLKIGADDYLFKPFLEEEVIIKLKNLFAKKAQKEEKITFNKKAVVFEEGKNQLEINHKVITLTSIEYKIIKKLIDNYNKIITREQFLDDIYSYGGDVFDRVIDVHIRNIRKKISKVTDTELIKTVYGLGYIFEGRLDE